jgi:hypothetical protein
MATEVPNTAEDTRQPAPRDDQVKDAQADGHNASTARRRAELLDVLERMEGQLRHLHGQFDNTERERQHQHFSAARLIGAILQALVLGLVIAGSADWVYGSPVGPLLVKLGFAAVFQLGALTAFLVAQERG